MNQQCIVTISHSIIKLSGPRTSVLLIENPGRRKVRRKELDGCLHPDGGICDWLIETDETDDEARDLRQVQLFVELKGKDCKHAADQLANALRAYPPNQNGFQSRCYIVGSGFPQFRARGQILEDRFQREFKVPLLTAKDGQTVPLVRPE